MGAGASTMQTKLELAQVKQIAGDKFDQELYDSYKDDDGRMGVDALLEAAASIGYRLDAATVQQLAGEQFNQELFESNKGDDGLIDPSQLLAIAGADEIPVPDGPVSDNQARRYCLRDGRFLQYCSPEQRDSMELCVTAVTNRGSALQFCSDRLKDNGVVVKFALKFDGTNIRYASPRLQGDMEIVNLALELLPSYSMKWDAVQLASKIYAKDHGAFKEAYLALRGDKEVCAVVVQEDGLGLKYCMPMVRHDKGVVKLAVAQNSQAVFYASPVALVPPDGPTDATTVDPEILAVVDKRFAEQDLSGAEKWWCADADAVETTTKRFPELAKYSPPPDFLEKCKERQAKEAAEAEAKKDAIWAAREAQEAKSQEAKAGEAKAE
mmetsp:Transcript_45604/g.102967  ORF Transcript_45604/g.102967 Transcript_45604/m.102967 type:complete len:381 (-) Transcript_45604:305-1447(-)